MTQVDFYILKNGEAADRLAFACRLTEKVYRLGHKIHIHAPEEEVGDIDELLWQQKPESFLPHNIIGEGPNAPPPIQIGSENQTAKHSDILINLSKQVPEFVNRYNRVVEIVPPQDEYKAVSREHFKHYRAQGFPLKTHDINN